MSYHFEISKNKCEICGIKATVAMNDNDSRLHYSCFNDIVQLWEKLGKP